MATVRYFTAPWCAPCKQLLPKVQKVCKEQGHQLEIVDIDKQSVVASAEGVQSVPTMRINDGPAFKATDVSFSKLREMLTDA